jgi:hypothetical protein
MVALALVAGSTAADTAKSPSALYSALLKAKVKALPHGYKKPVVTKYTVTPGAKAHHAVGGVAIVGDGGNEAVIYIIFATAADARLDWNHRNTKNIRVSAAPSSLPKPSLVANTSSPETIGTKTQTIGLTDTTCLVGNVIVQGVTSSTTNSRQGDPAGSAALTLFAVKHLKSLS